MNKYNCTLLVHSFVSRFGAGQVKHHGAKFGASFVSPLHPINAITIDSENQLHGWHVVLLKQGSETYNQEIKEFANSMKGVMKVHIIKLKTLGQPLITDLN